MTKNMNNINVIEITAFVCAKNIVCLHNKHFMLLFTQHGPDEPDEFRTIKWFFNDLSTRPRFMPSNVF